MVRRDTDIVIILDDGKPVGTVSSQDIVTKVLAANRAVTNVMAMDVMDTNPVIVKKDANIETVVERFLDNLKKPVLLVGETGDLTGIVTPTRITQTLLRQQSELADSDHRSAIE